MTIEWFKHYHGAAVDPKWLALADAAASSPAVVWATYSVALEYASKNEDRGKVSGFDPQIVASFFRVSLDEIHRILKAFVAKGIIVADSIRAWAKRQGAADKALRIGKSKGAIRTDRWRKNKALAGRQGTFDFALPPSIGIPSETVTGAAAASQTRVTVTTDSDLEPPSEAKEASEETRPFRSKKEEEAEFEGFWEQCPKKVGKKAARAAYIKARRSTDWNTLVSGMRRYAGECGGRDPQFIKHPKTWLNDGCWADEPFTVIQVPQQTAAEREAEEENERALRAAALAEIHADLRKRGLIQDAA